MRAFAFPYRTPVALLLTKAAAPPVRVDTYSAKETPGRILQTSLGFSAWLFLAPLERATALNRAFFGSGARRDERSGLLPSFIALPSRCC